MAVGDYADTATATVTDFVGNLIVYCVSFLSYRVVVICLASVPVSHFLGLYYHNPNALRLQNVLLFPFTGGNRHVVFQLLAWGLWALSALMGLPILLSYYYLTFFERPLPLVPHTHIDVVSGAAAACSFIGELCMLKAILVYDPASAPDSPRKHRKRANPQLASAAVVFMGILMSTTGCLLLLAVEHMPDMPSRVLYCCLSLSCLLMASTTSYGLGGFLRFGATARVGTGADPVDTDGAAAGAADGSGTTMWQFFQPFAGGTAFVATQAVGWSLFSATAVAVIILLQQLVAGVAYCARCWAFGLGVLMITTQLMLGASLLTWRGQKTAKRLLTPLLAAKEGTWPERNMPVILMYLPVHLFFTLWVLSFCFLPPHWALSGWVSLLLPYYILTTRGAPHHTGSRQWPWLCAWFTRAVEISLTHWFGNVEVIRDFEGEVDPDKRYIFGFHPHGLYPTGAGFLPMMPSFHRAFPGIRPVTLTASVLFFPPFIRDISSWAGFRQVTRHTFVHALQERGSVVMCPGGQAELVHTWRCFSTRAEVCIHTRHRGFIRIAIENGASLVPVMVMGEALQLRNLWNLPALQQFTYKRLGFPVPYWLAGRWWVTPLPNKVPLLYVLGEPIQPPSCKPGESVTAAMVDEVHAKYFQSLQDMFHKYQERHPNYKTASLVLVDD